MGGLPIKAEELESSSSMAGYMHAISFSQHSDWMLQPGPGPYMRLRENLLAEHTTNEKRKISRGGTRRARRERVVNGPVRSTVECIYSCEVYDEAPVFFLAVNH